MGDKARELRRLVELPAPEPRLVERHRDDHIGLVEKLGAGPAHPAGHQGNEIGPIAIFEGGDEAAGEILIENGGAKAPERGRIGDRFGRQEARTKVIGERQAKNLAEGPFDEAQGRPASRADRMGLGQRRLAARTGRRKDQAPEPAGETRRPAPKDVHQNRPPRHRRRLRKPIGSPWPTARAVRAT